jgi:hypothetical protein
LFSSVQALGPWLRNVAVLFARGAPPDRLEATLSSVLLPLGRATGDASVWDALISGPAADQVAAFAARAAARLLAKQTADRDETNAASCRDAAACTLSVILCCGVLSCHGVLSIMC